MSIILFYMSMSIFNEGFPLSHHMETALILTVESRIYKENYLTKIILAFPPPFLALPPL